MKKKAAQPPQPPTTAPTVTVQTAPAAPVQKTTDTEERPHHPYSPSTLQNLEACPCFIGRDSTTARAVAGTLAHKAVESREDNEKLDDDDAIAVAECLDFMESRRTVLVDEANRAWVAAGSVPGPESEKTYRVEELKEIYLPIDAVTWDDWTWDPREGSRMYGKCKATTAGYADLILLNWNKTHAELIDWKFGFWAVEKAEQNPQGIAYALGLFKMYPTLQTVRVWFKQPHIDFLTDALFKREQVPDLYLRVQAIVARARVARQAGDFQTAQAHTPCCNFCGNLGRCPIGLANALKVAKKFSPLDFPEDITPTKVMDPKNTSLALNLASVVKVWSEAFRRQVTDRVLRRDAPIPEGMMIQEMPGRRSIADLAKFRDVALRHVTQFEYEQCLDASFTPLETIIKDKAPRGTKKGALEAFQKELEDSGAVKRGDGFSFLKMRSGKTQE